MQPTFLQVELTVGLPAKKSTLVIPKTECNRHSAELTLLCAAAAAVTLQEVVGQSALCEIPWPLSRWLERLVLLCFFVCLFSKEYNISP